MYRVQSQRLPEPTRSAHTPTLRFPIPGTVQPGEASHSDVTQHTWAWLVPNWSLQEERGDPELLQTGCPLRISTPIWLSSLRPPPPNTHTHPFPPKEELVPVTPKK